MISANSTRFGRQFSSRIKTQMDLKRVAVVRDRDGAERFKSIEVLPVVDRSVPPGLDFAAFVVGELDVDPGRIGEWMGRQQERALSAAQAVAA